MTEKQKETAPLQNNASEETVPPPATGVSHFSKAFRYTCQGLRTAYREAAFRQELLLGVVAVPLAWWLFHPITAAVLTFGWLLVLAVELLNTAVEAVVNLVSPGYHRLAGQAKDLGSAAVGVALFGYFVLWGVALYLQFRHGYM